MRSFWLTLPFLFGFVIPPVVVSQNTVLRIASSFGSHQGRDEDRERSKKPGSPQSINAATQRLKQAINGKSVARNLCHSQQRDVRIEETTEISQTKGCHVIVQTRKTSTSGDERREIQFTLDANLSDLTMPVSVEPQSFSQCKPIDGTVLKVMSRAEPGKSVRTTRRTISEGAVAKGNGDELKPRADLSFFFSDEVAARKAARLLDRAVKLCGGKEWPDEDDLP